MSDEFTPAQLRAICALSRSTREGGTLPVIDLGPHRASTLRSLSWRGIVTVWWTRKGNVSFMTFANLTDYGRTFVPMALDWEKAQ